MAFSIKKLLLASVSAISILAAGLSACQRPATQDERQTAVHEFYITNATNMRVWTDPDTGCEYFVAQGFASPRVNPDGSMRCRPVVPVTDLKPLS